MAWPGFLSSSTPQPIGTAAPGSSILASPSDHVHAMPAAVAFTPTMKQSAALTITVNYAKYVLFGTLYVATMDISISSAGTAGNDIEVDNLPSAINDGMTAVNGGTFTYWTAAGTRYNGSLYHGNPLATAVSMQTNGQTGFFGISPAVTAGNGDRLWATLVGQTA